MLRSVSGELASAFVSRRTLPGTRFPKSLQYDMEDCDRLLSKVASQLRDAAEGRTSCIERRNAASAEAK
jgi:hypothetical protein